jgi:hypothetical protein
LTRYALSVFIAYNIHLRAFPYSFILVSVRKAFILLSFSVFKAIYAKEKAGGVQHHLTIFFLGPLFEKDYGVVEYLLNNGPREDIQGLLLLIIEGCKDLMAP